MESIFRRAPTTRPPTLFERLGPELVHLQQSTSVRGGSSASGRTSGWAGAIAVCALLGLYFMDPFLYAMHKYEAVQAYLYLHNHNSQAAAADLAATQIFSQDELDTLNRRHAAPTDSFASPQAAEQKTVDIINYMNALHRLHAGQYEQLDAIGKLRYLLFVRTGLVPPTEWNGLNPSVQ